MSNKGRLCLEERQILYRHQESGIGKKAVARMLGRCPKTIREELKRNKHPFPEVWEAMSYLEKAKYADDKSRERLKSRRKGKKKLLSDETLREHVVHCLTEKDYSPEQISETISEELPGYSISFKTIYNTIKKDFKWLIESLWHRGKAYRQRVCHPRSRLKEGAPAKVLITERSEACDNRDEFGHWEVDTIHSRRGGSKAILTLRERKSRERFYFLIEDLRSETVLSRLMPFFRSLPQHMRLSITADNGSEFSTKELHKLKSLGMAVFHCHAFSPYERGAVEQANGELRRYFPKKTNFGTVSSRELFVAQNKLNNRPMKVLGFKKSSDVYNAALKGQISLAR
jgi:IS30 family transposase